MLAELETQRQTRRNLGPGRRKGRAGDGELLQAPNLVERILKDCATLWRRRRRNQTKLVGYLAATFSRKLGKPLCHSLPVGSSGGGQSRSLYGCGAVVHPARRTSRLLADDRAKALFYNWRNESQKQNLSIAEEGRRRAGKLRAEAAPKEGQLTIASTGKDPAAGTNGNAGVSRRRPRDDLLNDHRHRHRTKKLIEPLHRLNRR